MKNVPPEDDVVQWLSIMQHHGAPTRIIDFTWSPFVAAYFALTQSVKESAVWAVYPAAFDYHSKITLLDGNTIQPRKYWPENSNIFKRKFLQANIPFVVQGEPNAMNDRLIAQSGTFAIPSVINLSLEQILLNYPDSDKVIVKFVLDTKKIRDQAMSYMHVTNINESTLFPGIDRMARSLAYELEYNWAYNPKTMKKVPGYKTPTYGFPAGVTN